MSTLNFSFVPLTFINSESEILRQIRNTTVFSYLFEKYDFTKNLSELIENTQYGYNAAATDIGTHKFLRISDIKEGDVNWDDVPFCDCKDEKTYKLFDDDILIARTGGTTGKSFIITNPPDNAVFAGYLIRMRAKSDIDPIYIYEFLNSYVYWSQISNLKMGSAQPNVNAEKLKTLIIPYGPDEVIKEVVHFFKTGDSQIEELNERVQKGQSVQNSNFQLNDLFSDQLTLITSLRQAILTEAVQGQLTAQWRKENPNPEHARELLKRIAAEKAQLIKEKKISKEKPLPVIKEEDMPYELPEGWAWCLSDEIVSFNGGVAKGKEQKGKMVQTPYLRVANVQRGRLDLNVVKEIIVSENDYQKYQLQIDDLLMIEGGDPDKVGRCAIWRNEIPNCIHQNHIFRVRVYLVNELNVQFLETFFNSPVCQKYFEKSAKQTTNLASINKSQMRIAPIAIPPLTEQHAIVQKVNTLQAHCDELEQQVQQSKADLDLLMQSVLGEVFGGNVQKNNQNA
jgi:type I restriction enzyme S subunit